MNNFESKIRPALLEKHGDMTEEGVAVFRRKWEVSLTSKSIPLIHTDQDVSTTSGIAKPASSPRLWGMLSSLLDETAPWSSWRGSPNDASPCVASAWIQRDLRRFCTHFLRFIPSAAALCSVGSDHRTLD